MVRMKSVQELEMFFRGKKVGVSFEPCVQVMVTSPGKLSVEKGWRKQTPRVGVYFPH